jgi:hypothetical protein
VLEKHLERELKGARHIARRCGGHSPEAGAAQRRVRSSELDPVKRVEQLHTELPAKICTIPEALRDGHIPIVRPAVPDLIDEARRIAECEIGWLLERIGVEPAVDGGILECQSGENVLLGAPNNSGRPDDIV